MQVSTRIFHPDVTLGRVRALAPRHWTRDPVPPVRADERGGGYKGTLARGSHQPVNDGPPSGSGDKAVFVARSLTSTLAMLQMKAVPGTEEAARWDAADPADQGGSTPVLSFIDELLSACLAPSPRDQNAAPQAKA